MSISLSCQPDRPGGALLPSRRRARRSGAPHKVAPTSTDTLSEVLSAVHLTGSVFFDISARAPWVAEAPPSAQVADKVTPGAQHAIEYHVVANGSCWITPLGDAASEPVRLEEGDIAVFPHGDPHAVSSAPGMRAQPMLEIHRQPNEGEDLPFVMRVDDDGPVDARLFCGFFSCDVRPFNPLIAALPRFIRVGRDASRASGGLLDQFIRFATAEAGSKRAGSRSILTRLSELMFVEVVRLHMDRLVPSDETGWLAGLRDPLVGRALTLLHARPAHAWTLDGLAAQAGASRSALAERFASLVGCPPIQYLTRWRMQVAARRLTEPGVKVATVAFEVGYASEAAFSRAFKKVVGRSPGQWRPAES